MKPRLFKDWLCVLIGPGVSTFRELAAAPKISVLAASAAQKLTTGGTAKCLGRHAIIVSEPRLATLVETGAVPIEASTIFCANHATRANWTSKSFVGRLRGFAIFVE